MGVKMVGIGMYVLNVGNIKLIEASFYADFLLFVFENEVDFASIDEAQRKGWRKGTASCSDTFLNSPNTTKLNREVEDYLAFINMDKGRTVRKIFAPDSNTIDHFRVMSLFYFKTSLRQWPFDTQYLDFVLETIASRTHGDLSTLFCHLDAYSGLSPMIRFPGISGRSLDLKVAKSVKEVCWPPFARPAASQCEHQTPEEQSCFCLQGRNHASRHTVTITYARPFQEAMVKTIFPPLIISLVTLGSYVFPSKDYAPRLGVCAAGLTSAVMFHVSVSAATPPNNMLTRADALMFAVYFANLFAWINSALVMNFFSNGEKELADAINFGARILGPPISITSFFLGVSLNTDYWWVPETLAITVATLSFPFILYKRGFCCAANKTEKGEDGKKEEAKALAKALVDLLKLGPADQDKEPEKGSEAIVFHLGEEQDSHASKGNGPSQTMDPQDLIGDDPMEQDVLDSLEDEPDVMDNIASPRHRRKSIMGAT